MRCLCLLAILVFSACSRDRIHQASFADREYVAVEELRIGSPDDAELAFTWFRELAVGPDGSIYTLHPQEQTIRVHDTEGSFIRTVGRRGEGPGEFKSVGRMGILGDTLWTLDFGTYRFTFFSLQGEFLGTSRIPVDLGQSLEESPPRPNGLFSDGSISGSFPAWSRLVARGEITTNAILKMDSAGQVEDTIVTYSVQNTTWEVTNPDNPNSFGSYRPQPFSDTEIVKISDHAPLIVRVNRRVPDDPAAAYYQVAAWRFDGDTVFSRSFAYDPVPLGAALVDSAVDRFSAFFKTRRFARAPTPEQAATWARRSLYVPKYHPPVSDMIIGQDGSIWLRGESLPDSMAEWRILSSDGKAVGQVHLPSRFGIMAATLHTLWGSELDELDVPYIVRYRIVPKDGAA